MTPPKPTSVRFTPDQRRAIDTAARARRQRTGDPVTPTAIIVDGTRLAVEAEGVAWPLADGANPAPPRRATIEDVRRAWGDPLAHTVPCYPGDRPWGIDAALAAAPEKV